MEKIRQLVRSGSWGELERLLESVVFDGSSSHVAVETIYLLHSVLWDLPKDKFDIVHHLLIRFFEKSSKVFSDDPAYLFFVGSLICLCDWCFGLEDVSLGIEMLKRAAALEPTSLLFRWGHSFSTNQPDAELLSRKIAENQPVLDFLSTWETAGANIAEQIRGLPYFLSLPRQ